MNEKNLNKIVYLILAFVSAAVIGGGIFAYFNRTAHVSGQTSQVQLTQIFSASSTLPNDNIPAEYCTTVHCHAIFGTTDPKVSSSTTGGTFITGNATTSILQFETGNTEKIAINLLHFASSTSATNTVLVAFESSNDGIEWYPYNQLVPPATTNAYPASNNIGSGNLSLTGTSSSVFSWSVNDGITNGGSVNINPALKPHSKTRLILPVLLARNLRINVRIVNFGIADPYTASGTIRAEVIRLNPF